MATMEERVARIECGYEHLATKADLARLEGKLETIESRLLLKMGGIITVATGIVIAAIRFW